MKRSNWQASKLIMQPFAYTSNDIASVGINNITYTPSNFRYNESSRLSILVFLVKYCLWICPVCCGGCGQAPAPLPQLALRKRGSCHSSLHAPLPHSSRKTHHNIEPAPDPPSLPEDGHEKCPVEFLTYLRIQTNGAASAADRNVQFEECKVKRINLRFFHC